MDLTERYEELRRYYRRVMEGHVGIRRTLDMLFDALAHRIDASNAPHVLEIGCHAGITTEWLLARFPQVKPSVWDDDDELSAIARFRLEPRGVRYVARMEDLTEPVRTAYSIARHHHLPHGYLSVLRQHMHPDGVYIVADELCPEYCDGAREERLSTATLLRFVGGYTLTSEQELAAYEATKEIPTFAMDLEDRRRVALWRWYRFVVDRAVDRGYFDVAAGELRSASDDLVTGSDAEHKFSPLVVEREFALAGFRLLSKRAVLGSAAPELQSFFVYQFGLA